MRQGYHRRQINEHMNVILNSANTAQVAAVTLDNARYETIHVFGMFSCYGHLSVLGIDDNVMK